MNPKWVWLKPSLTGGAGGGAYEKVFSNTDFSPEDLLAREVIQNSWDAALSRNTSKLSSSKPPPFTFRFRFSELTGEKKKKFIETLDLEEVKKHRESTVETKGIPSRESINDMLDLQKPLKLLYLEDFGTHGMYGDPADTFKSHLYKALYVLGFSGKDDEGAGRGGSFGFGKSAFIRASGAQSAIVHTRFNEPEKDKATQRLIGFTWWAEHSSSYDSETYFEGRAMFGTPHKNTTQGANALTDTRAAEIAVLLGMCERTGSPGKRGTSILLLDPQVDPEKLVRAVELYWWPALEDHLMDIEIVKHDGEVLIPRPGSNGFLKPFRRAYGIAKGEDKRKSNSEQGLASGDWHEDIDGKNYKYGKLGLVIDQEYSSLESSDLSENSEGETPYSGPMIALLRGPLMVIEYKAYKSLVPVRGVFVASDDIDSYLREVEPASHNSWSHTRSRDSRMSDEARKIANTVLRKIKESVNEFAKNFSPPPLFVPTDLKYFGDLIGKYFDGIIGGPQKPPSESKIDTDRISIYSIGDRELVPEFLSLVLKQRIGVKVPLDQKWSDAQMSFTVKASPQSEFEISSISAEEISAKITLSPPGFSLDDANSMSIGSVIAGEKYEFSVEIGPYPNHLTVITTPRAEIEMASDENNE